MNKVGWNLHLLESLRRSCGAYLNNDMINTVNSQKADRTPSQNRANGLLVSSCQLDRGIKLQTYDFSENDA